MAPFASNARRNGPLFGTFLMFNSIFSAQLVASSGYDCILLDMEHSPISALEATHIVHAVGAASNGSCAALVRVPSHGVEWIKWALDSGASGIVIPMVNSKEEIELIVSRACYPPLGQRSFGPLHAPFANRNSDRTTVAEYFSRASADIAIIAMIESKMGVKNAEQIIGAEGVSAVFVGPMDLRLSLGLMGADGDEPEFHQALVNIVQIAEKHSKPAGIMALTQTSLIRHVNLGFKFILYQSDSSLLAQSAQASLENAKAALVFDP
jgi:2-keto-3-deoxy-L-rhamnonate aldolase RhmA